MKNLIIIGLLISQAVSLVHIGHMEASKKNREFSFFFDDKPEQKAPAPAIPVRHTEPAELLPDIESFDDSLRGELFPEVAEAKPVRKKR